MDYGLGPSLHGSWFRQTLGSPPPSRGEGFRGDSEVLSLGSQADRRFIVCFKKWSSVSEKARSGEEAGVILRLGCCPGDRMNGCLDLGSKSKLMGKLGS